MTRNNPFVCLHFIDGWYCRHLPIKEVFGIFLYAKFLAFGFAWSKCVVMLKRDFTTSGCLVLFSSEVTIIKWSHLIVSATALLLVCPSYAWRNNLKQKDKNAQLTLINFIRTVNELVFHKFAMKYKSKLKIMFTASSHCWCPDDYFVRSLSGVCSLCGRLLLKETVGQLPLDSLGEAGSLFSHH